MIIAINIFKSSFLIEKHHYLLFSWTRDAICRIDKIQPSKHRYTNAMYTNMYKYTHLILIYIYGSCIQCSLAYCVNRRLKIQYFCFRISFEITNTWGYPNENGSWNGMTGMLERREIDIAGTPSFLVPKRISVVQHLQLYTHTR